MPNFAWNRARTMPISRASLNRLYHKWLYGTSQRFTSMLDYKLVHLTPFKDGITFSVAHGPKVSGLTATCHLDTARARGPGHSLRTIMARLNCLRKNRFCIYMPVLLSEDHSGSVPARTSSDASTEDTIFVASTKMVTSMYNFWSSRSTAPNCAQARQRNFSTIGTCKAWNWQLTTNSLTNPPLFGDNGW